MNHQFTFGIEEEYFISDRVKRDAARARVKDFLKTSKDILPDAVQSEMLEPQIEIATSPCTTMQEARRQLQYLRTQLASIADQHDLSIMAAGTHPLAIWTRQRTTPAARYGKLMHDLQMVGSRNMVCGMHVHVEVESLERRVDLMKRVMPYLPLILALSTSSPFWQAQRTGLLGYRLAAYNELPRTGLPELFEDVKEYQTYIDTLVAARAIEDSSFVWWLVRPSLRHPTLELRVADSCTRVEDSLAIAALFRCLICALSRNSQLNLNLKSSSRAIIAENCWRAQRYGIHGSFVDEATRTARPVSAVLEDVLALVMEDAQALGCEAELLSCRTILAEGTSADRQLAIFTEAVGRGLSTRDSLVQVVDWLGDTTRGHSGLLH